MRRICIDFNYAYPIQKLKINKERVYLFSVAFYSIFILLLNSKKILDRQLFNCLTLILATNNMIM